MYGTGMYTMQYEITLPADYDMTVIRERVAAKGSSTDGFPGLGFKAYLVRERGADGSPVNQYAPFYLWRSTSGMAEFLSGKGFAGLSADFGRPVVRQWLALGWEPGPGATGTPVTATKTVRAISQDESFEARVDTALTTLRDTARRPGVHTTAVAVDPTRWEVVHFTLRTGDAAPELNAASDLDTAAVRYRVAHLSSAR